MCRRACWEASKVAACCLRRGARDIHTYFHAVGACVSLSSTCNCMVLTKIDHISLVFAPYRADNLGT
jgi:hypothetical protein